MLNVILCVILFISTKAMADVWVVTAPDKSVYSLSEQNDAVIPSGYTVKKISGKIADIGLSRSEKLYTFDGSKFKIDTVKVKAIDDAQIAADTALANKKAKKQSAKDKLKALGLDQSEVDAIIGGD